MPCDRGRPTFAKRKYARRHGYITYGKGNFYTYKVKGGWRVGRR